MREAEAPDVLRKAAAPPPDFPGGAALIPDESDKGRT